MLSCCVRGSWLSPLEQVGVVAALSQLHHYVEQAGSAWTTHVALRPMQLTVQHMQYVCEQTNNVIPLRQVSGECNTRVSWNIAGPLQRGYKAFWMEE